jgi:RNA polymerase sigma-70 factor, ECF subfamily
MSYIQSDTSVNFNKLIAETQISLFRFILSLIPHKHDAEDILQKTNLILFQKQKLFNPKKGSFKNWAFTIAKFQVFAHKTKIGRSKICLSNELTEILANEVIDHETPHIKRQALNKCYKKLPKHMSKIAELRFKRDLSVKEISLCIDRPIGSVSATLHRIRSNIMKCINVAYKEAEKEFHNQ